MKGLLKLVGAALLDGAKEKAKEIVTKKVDKLADKIGKNSRSKSQRP